MNFKITKNKGFCVTFPNGYMVSVQFGAGNYSTNYHRSFDEDCSQSNTAETAIIDPKGHFVSYKGDDVQGYQSAADVLETMNYAAGL